MYRINWDQFKTKNLDKHKAFEELCYHLFCRKFSLSEGIRADFNEVGLETKPIFFKNKHYGFQAKFFKHTNDGDQIKKSVEKAIKNFKGNLNVIYIYLNNPIGTKAKYVETIKGITGKHNIKIEWIVPSNFEILLAKPSNLDLAQLYFDYGDEFGFIKSSCDTDIITFLQSSSYLTLPLKGIAEGKNLEKEILKSQSGKIFLLLGQPGSGKTLFMNKLLMDFGGLDQDDNEKMRGAIGKNKALPMLVNLKDCTFNSIENIIRDRQKDYKVRKKDTGFIYILDGLDELESERTDGVLSHILALARDEQTKKVIISCRSGSQNRYLFKTYFPKAKEYEIDQLDIEYIDRYFRGKNAKEKIDKLQSFREKNSDILKDIKDIFLISLLWDTIENINLDSSLTDLFHQKINLLLEDPRFKKNIEELNLPNPKKDAIIFLNQDISFEFQKNFQYRFDQKEIQNIILKEFPLLNYHDLNAIFNYLCSHFFTPRETEKEKTQSYIYQHRRYQEFFFTQKLKIEYEKNRRILRELNVLSNRNFFETIFLPYLRQEYERKGNLVKLIELNLISVYLGGHKGYGADDSYYMNSSSFIPSLVYQERNTFERLLSDENLQIGEKIPAEPENIVYFWKADKQIFAKKLLSNFKKLIEKAKSGEEKIQKWVNDTIWHQWESWIFMQLIINKKKVTKIFKDLVRRNYKHFSDKRQYSFEESGREKLLKSFLRVCLDQKRRALLKLIDIFDEYEFLTLLNVLSDLNYLPYFIKEKTLHKKIKKFLKGYSKDIGDDNFFILFFKRFLNIKLTKKDKEFAKERLLKIQQERAIDWRLYKAHFQHALISYALEENRFDSLFKNLNKDLPNYYNELFLYSTLFCDFVDILRGRKKIGFTIRSYLSYINSHEKIRGLYLKVDMSLLWSCIFANTKEKPENLLPLKNLLVKDENDVISFTFLRELRVKNEQLFNKITNEQEIEILSHGLDRWEDDLPSYVDRCFDIAILFSTLNSEKATLFISKGINEGILRHGWRKDIIVSYNLVDALEILWRNNWGSRQTLKKYTEGIFDLTLRVSEITDGKGTWRGPYNMLDLVAKYDIELAEKLRKKLYKQKGYYNVLNSAITSVILGRIKQGITLEQIEGEMNKYRKNYDYESKPFADYYEQKFLIYLSITQNDLYTPEEKKQAFFRAHEQIKEMKKNKISYFLRDMDFKKEKGYFKKLCKKYGKRYNIPPEKKEKSYSIKPKIKEKDFIRKLKNITTKKKLNGLYRRLSNYKNGIVLEKKESWEVLVNKTYKIYGNINFLIKLLRENNYPHTDFWTSNSKYFHYAIAAALQNVNTKDEILKYLYLSSGHQGFLNIMKAYEINNDRDMCSKLFKEFFDFCDFLVN